MPLFWCKLMLGKTRLGVVITQDVTDTGAAAKMLRFDLPEGSNVEVRQLKDGAPVPSGYLDRMLSLDEVEKMTREALGPSAMTMH